MWKVKQPANTQAAVGGAVEHSFNGQGPAGSAFTRIAQPLAVGKSNRPIPCSLRAGLPVCAELASRPRRGPCIREAGAAKPGSRRKTAFGRSGGGILGHDVAELAPNPDVRWDF
jgi:hypothetical protein